MTYPDPHVQELIAASTVPVKVMLNRREDQAHFRAHRVIWTPTLVFLDRRGVSHYQAPGYLPPDLFAAQLRLGVARVLLAWGGYDQAAALLGPAADEPDNALAPEVLYWLGVAVYLKERRRAPMMVYWNRLRELYPASAWAARIPPNQDDGSEP